MNRVFADTSYWIARAIPRDQWRDVAIAAYEGLGDEPQIVTTEEVLTEFLAHLSHRGPESRREAVDSVLDILSDPSIQVVQQTHRSFTDGLVRYASRLDKGYSLQDCVSMNVMESEGITEVLTNDRHFEREGFTILMR